MKSLIRFAVILCLISMIPSAWSQHQYLIEIREVEKSDLAEAEDGTPAERKVRNVLISHIKGGAPLSYKRLVSGNYQLLFRGKLTELEDGRVKIEYLLDQSILGVEPPEPLRIAGTIETAVGSEIDPVVLEGSDSQSSSAETHTHWELEVREFDDTEVLDDETDKP